MDKEARKVTKSIATLGKNIKKTGVAMTKYITGPLAIAGGAVIKFGADFDKAMTSSLAIMGDVTDAMRKDMSDAAREVGKTTKYSATQAAEAYYFLASAGLSAKQSIEALPKVAAFAQAGQFDLSLATDLLTDAQSALGLVVKDVAKNMQNMTLVSDVLVKANTLANASVQQFSESLTNKAGAALRVLGKELQEGVAVLAVYADQGVKGAEAGSQLNIVLRDLQKAAINNKKAFQNANVAVFDQEGEMRNLADIISDLEGRLGGMSDEQRKTELMTLGFTEKSISATIALLGTSDAIREYETKLKSAGGITDEVSKKQLQNFWDQLNLVKSELIDVGLTIWQSLEPILTNKLIPALRKVSDFIKGVAGWFDGLNKATKETVFVMAAIVMAFGPFLLVLGKALVVTKALTASMILMNASMLANPFTLAALAITAIGTAIIYTSAAWEEWKKSISDKIAEKQTSALKKNLEDIIPLYGELALMNRQPMGEKKFKEVSDKVKELETNLADLGYEFTGNFGNRAVEAENTLTDLTLTTKELGDEIDRTAKKIETMPKAGDKTGGDDSSKNAQAKIEWSKKLIQQRISETNNLAIQLKNQLALFDIEQEEEIKTAEETGIAVADIKALYARKKIQAEEEYYIAVKDLEDKNLQNKKTASDREQEIADARIEAKWKDFETEKQMKQELHDRQIAMFNTVAMAIVEFNNSMSQIIDNYYQKQFNLISVKEQKEIAAVNKSTMTEEMKRKKIEEIEKKAAKEESRLRKEQAKKNKAFALFNAVIGTAASIVNAMQLMWPLNLAMAIIYGVMGAVQIAAIASQPLPLARGGMVKAGRGGVEAQIGEGSQDELVLPMKTGVQALADALILKLSSIELPKLITPSIAFDGAGGSMGSRSASGEVHLHIGTLVADDSGLKELEQTLLQFRVSNEMRKGRER